MFRRDIARNPSAISEEEREARKRMLEAYKPRVEEEEVGVGGNALSWSTRRQQVDDFTEETAAKQFRLREISDHHLFRKRPYLSSLDNISAREPPITSESDANIIFDHIIAIMALQNCEGAFFNSLSQNEQETIREYFAQHTEGKPDTITKKKCSC